MTTEGVQEMTCVDPVQFWIGIPDIIINGQSLETDKFIGSLAYPVLTAPTSGAGVNCVHCKVNIQSEGFGTIRTARGAKAGAIRPFGSTIVFNMVSSRDMYGVQSRTLSRKTRSAFVLNCCRSASCFINNRIRSSCDEKSSNTVPWLSAFSTTRSNAIVAFVVTLLATDMACRTCQRAPLKI